MKKINLGIVLTLALAISGCAMTKGQQQPSEQQKTAQTSTQESGTVQTELKDQQSFNKASDLTAGWPEASRVAAEDMITRYGNPDEVTAQRLVWRGKVAPFKEIIVHKEVYTHKFPLLHQNALEHVVEYDPIIEKVDDVLRYNGAIVFNITKGQMSSFAESEAMNILALNLADQVMKGRLGADAARVKYGKETLEYMNGNKSALTAVLDFGGQFETADQGESVTNKIRWIGDPDRTQTREAQEEKKDKKK